MALAPITVRSPLRDLPDFPKLPPELLRVAGMTVYHAEMEAWWFRTKTVLLRTVPAPTPVVPVDVP